MHGVGAATDHRELADLVHRAAAGDQRAWDRLVDRFSGLLWSITSAYRLSQADAADVVQTTWMKLLENLGHLRQPDGVGLWLATTVRRECLRVLREGRHVVLTDDERRLSADPDPMPTPEAAMLRSERDRQLWRAVTLLPEHCQRLLRVLVAEGASYKEVAVALDMPIGSIGPTRARCLERLRRTIAADARRVHGELREGAWSVHELCG
jgi:RNA polymerase sigma factor (sigma-70 family)